MTPSDIAAANSLWQGARPLRDSERAMMIGEAHRWLMTPWAHSAAVRGHGVDCGRLMIVCVAAAVPGTDTAQAPYPPDWMQHRDDSDMMRRAARFGVLTPWDGCAAPGDILLMHFGRCVSHAAIVSGEYPEIIHAYAPAGRVVRDSAEGFKRREGGVWVSSISYKLEVMTWED